MSLSPVQLKPRPVDLANRKPEEVAATMSHLDGFVFLDSSSATPGAFRLPGHDTPAGEISLLTAFPRRVLQGHLDDPGELRAALHTGTSAPGADWGVPLGGAFGCVAFDGSYTFGIYDHLLFYSHAEEQWYETGELLAQLECAPQAEPICPLPIDFSFPVERCRFCEAVNRAKDYIASGDIYQVNLSQRAVSTWSPRHDPFLLYEHLREISPSPHAAFLNVGGRTILSSSPELFLKMSGEGILTRPIKGTRPRFSEPNRDEKSACDLITSPKEVAELLMITDLERNDLGRVCEYGSVEVTELLKLERFAQVFHLVSTIQGTLVAGDDHLGALRACFPGGSISGAPKKRALEIIAELEPVPRGLYTGAIGYLGFNGESQFNIAIRTAVIEGESISFHVGAGIVADSDPGLEYEETLHKAAGLLAAARAYHLSCAAAYKKAARGASSHREPSKPTL